MAACGAKKRSGGFCQAPAMPNGKCRLHGGKTPSGLASPHFKHGKYAKDLPTRLQARYQVAQDDPRLLELRDDIALLDARLADVLGRVDSGESGRIWQELVSAKQDWIKAKGKDKDHFLDVMLGLIHDGIADYAAWEDVRSLLTQRRQLVESERKRLVELQQTMTAERAMLLLGAATNGLRESVLRHCQHDPQLANRILTDASAAIRGLVSVGDRGILNTTVRTSDEHTVPQSRSD